MGRLYGVLGLSAILLLPLQGFGWGKKAHQLVEVAAIELLPKSSFKELLKANVDGMKELCMVPDLRWKHGPKSNKLEANTHFFEIDNWGKDIRKLPRDFSEIIEKYERKEILDYGTAPFRIVQISNLLVEAMKNHELLQTVQLASVLGHYMGDMGQPFHAVNDYDGVEAGHKGIHSYYETKTVDGIDEEELLVDTISFGESAARGYPDALEPLDYGYTSARKSFGYLKKIIKVADDNGLSKDFKTAIRPILNENMGNSAGSLARIWQSLYIKAGSPQLHVQSVNDEKGQVPFPDWIALDYLK